MEYISLRCYDIPEHILYDISKHVFLIMISLIEGCLQGSFFLNHPLSTPIDAIITFVFYICEISVSQMTTDISLLAYSQSCPFSIECDSPNWTFNRFLITFAKWQMPNVDQNLLTLPDHMRSHPVYGRVRVAQSYVFYVLFFIMLCLSGFFFSH